MEGLDVSFNKNQDKKKNVLKKSIRKKTSIQDLTDRKASNMNVQAVVKRNGNNKVLS